MAVADGEIVQRGCHDGSVVDQDDGQATKCEFLLTGSLTRVVDRLEGGAEHFAGLVAHRTSSRHDEGDELVLRSSGGSLCSVSGSDWFCGQPSRSWLCRRLC